MTPVCELCGEPMPAGEEMFKFHGYSGPCPKPPLRAPRPEGMSDDCGEEVSARVATVAAPVISRVWQMPNSATFDIPAIGALVKRHIEASVVSVDPFARNKRWAKLTNDLNPSTSAEYHMDATEFLEMLHGQGRIADLVIIDPPYSPRQVKECYNSIGHKMKQGDALGAIRKKLKAAIHALLVPGGRVIHCGWNTVGMGTRLGYQQEEILLVCHGSDHNDTIVTVERKLI